MSPTVRTEISFGRVPLPSLHSRSSLQCNGELRVKWKHGERGFYTHSHTLGERGERDAMPSHDLFFSSTLTWLPGKPRGKEAEGGVRLNQWGASFLYKSGEKNENAFKGHQYISLCVWHPVKSSNCLCVLKHSGPLFMLFLMVGHTHTHAHIYLTCLSSWQVIRARSWKKPWTLFSQNHAGHA